MPELPDEPWGSTSPCPYCAQDMRPILWGLPGMDDPAIPAAERGEVFLGGCIVPEGPIPQWHCPGCGRDVRVAEVSPEA